jgi:hypothetical protein
MPVEVVEQPLPVGSNLGDEFQCLFAAVAEQQFRI